MQQTHLPLGLIVAVVLLQLVAGIAAHGSTIGHEGHPKPEELSGSISFDAGSIALQWWKTFCLAIVGSCITSVAPALLIFFVPRSVGTSVLNVLLAFASAGLLGDVFLHMLPHVLGVGHHDDHGHSTHEAHDHHHRLPPVTAMLLLLAGIGSFFLVEGVMFAGTPGGHSHGAPSKRAAKEKASDASDDDLPNRKPSNNKKFATPQQLKQGRGGAPSPTRGHDKDEERRNGRRAWLNLMADASHNFTDGIAIGASFLTSHSMGMRTVLVILVHEVPHELGDFAVLRGCGWSIKHIFGAQLFTAIGNLAGVIVVLLANSIVDSLQLYLMPFVAGTFVYVATVVIMGDLAAPSSKFQRLLQTLAFAAGIALLHYVSVMEEKLGVHAH